MRIIAFIIALVLITTDIKANYFDKRDNDEDNEEE
tara:strand:- start:392 stop:496 length:105 start_codon:yes stop_codon:yes gene_type:complete